MYLEYEKVKLTLYLAAKQVYIYYGTLIENVCFSEQLEKVKAELEKYKGCEERERTLKTEVEKLKDLLSDKDKILSDKSAR